MRTNLIGYILGSEKRKKIIKTLFEYPNRQWTCSSLEDLTRLSHATVYRVIVNLYKFGILKQYKLSRKMVVYELVKSPLLSEIEHAFKAEKKALVKITRKFINKIKSRNIISVILYGSLAMNKLKQESDIDVLILLRKDDKKTKDKIFNKAAEISSKYNKTISTVIMNNKEFKKLIKKKDKFILNVLKGEVLYGKKPS